MYRPRPAVLMVVLLVATGVASASSTITRVVSSGDAAPGGGTFERFSVEALPVVAPVNSRGQVAFFASLLRGSGSEGFFLGDGTRIAKVVLEGDPTPAGGVFSGFGRHPIPALNDAGTVAFAAAVAGGRTVEGIFLAGRAGLRTVVVAGAAAPDVAAGAFAGVDAPALNDRGTVAFLATVRRGRESLEAVYLAAGGKLRKVVIQGDPAPAGGMFAGFGPPAVNGRDSVAFAAVVEGKAVPGGIFVSEGGRLRMIAGAGHETPVGGIFMKFSERVSLDDAGRLAFTALIKNGPVQEAIFVTDGGRLRKVVAIDDPAPGGGKFSHFGLWPVLGGAGTLGFTASVDGGPTPAAAFAGPESGFERIAGIGDALPGGGTLASFGLYPLVAMSAGGAVSFAIAPTATGEGREAIYVTRPATAR